MPKVSVLIPAHNEQDSIERCLRSITNQTFQDFEVIVVDDGSTDLTSKLVRDFHDSRVSLLQHDRNMGVSFSLNKGLDYCTGEYIARLDADDIALPERLDIQSTFLDHHPQIALCGTWALTINKATQSVTFMKPHIENGKIRKSLQKDNPFVHSTIMFRKEVTRKVGKYGTLQGFEDYDLWLRIASRFRVCNIPEILAIRYDNNNFAWKRTWKGISKSEVYRKRLSYQLKAVKLFGMKPLTIIFLTKTLLSISLSTLGESIIQK